MPNDSVKIPVIELFGPTIQGEGSMCGIQTHFIRFGGCDYRCVKCDSMHAVDGEQIKQNATYMTPGDIYERIMEHINPSGVKTITFSGGNPALWELDELVYALGSQKIKIAVETQGTYYKPWIRECDVVTVSPKGPGMGEKFLPDEFRTYCSELKGHQGFSVKVVVFDQRDLEFAIEVDEIMRTVPSYAPFYLSLGNPLPPVPHQPDTFSKQDHREMLLREYEMMAQDILGDPRCARFIFLPQLHVLAWGNKQGV